MTDLNKVKLSQSAIGGRIVLARFGKDPNIALDTRDAQNEFLQTIVAYAFDGKMPQPGEAREVQFGGGDEQFVMTVRRVDGSN